MASLYPVTKKKTSRVNETSFLVFLWIVQVASALALIILLSLEVESAMKKNDDRNVPKWILFNIVATIFILSITGVELAIYSMNAQHRRGFLISSVSKFVICCPMVVWSFKEVLGEVEQSGLALVVVILDCVVCLISTTALIHLLIVLISSTSSSAKSSPGTKDEEQGDAESGNDSDISLSPPLLPRPLTRPPTIILTTDTETKSIYDEIPGSPCPSEHGGNDNEMSETQTRDEKFGQQRPPSWPLSAHPVYRDENYAGLWKGKKSLWERRMSDQTLPRWADDCELPSDFM